MRQSSGVSFAPSCASAAASVSLTGRAPFMPRLSTRMYWSASTSPGRRVISLPLAFSRIMVGYPLTLKREPSRCALGVSPSMYTGMKKRDRSMKSWRLKIVALTWLHGGHHTAPQYRNTGLFSFFAAANAASTSPLYQAMPASLDADPDAAALAAEVEGVAAAVAAGVS